MTRGRIGICRDWSREDDHGMSVGTHDGHWNRGAEGRIRADVLRSR